MSLFKVINVITLHTSYNEAKNLGHGSPIRHGVRIRRITVRLTIKNEPCYWIMDSRSKQRGRSTSYIAGKGLSISFEVI